MVLFDYVLMIHLLEIQFYETDSTYMAVLKSVECIHLIKQTKLRITYF